MSLPGHPPVLPNREPAAAGIVLATINARYIHAALGLRYLYANLGELKDSTALMEFDLKQKAAEIVEEILGRCPRIVGLGVYIWNVDLTTEVVEILKKVSPQTVVVLGGPEVSYETGSQRICALADHVICGEADLKFGELCRGLLAGETGFPAVIHAQLPPLESVAFPYECYSQTDLAERVVYVEASRGCPFTCEFCLSSADIPVRSFPLQGFLDSLEKLMQRGARTFKFVDRTFNLSLQTSRTILQFFLDRWQSGMFVHFEMVPDRMPEALMELLEKFPVGGVQLEVGIQTFDEATARNISRRQNYHKLEQNIRKLRERTGVHIHADLIAGLPGESLESFARGFDLLVGMAPQEIQVGILKRLRGTPITRHDREWEMSYNPNPPYEILENKLLSFNDIQKLKRFARFWDLFANSGRFSRTLPLLWAGGNSPFACFSNFSEWLVCRFGRTHSMALVSLAESLYLYLATRLPVDRVRDALAADWCGDGVRRERLPFLENTVSGTAASAPKPASRNRRQERHREGQSRGIGPSADPGGDSF